MKQIILTDKQAELLKEYLIFSKSYRLAEIAYYASKRDNLRAEHFRNIDKMADEIICILQNKT